MLQMDGRHMSIQQRIFNLIILDIDHLLMIITSRCLVCAECASVSCLSVWMNRVLYAFPGVQDLTFPIDRIDVTYPLVSYMPSQVYRT